LLSGHAPGFFPGGVGEGPRHLAFHPNGRWVYFVNEQGKSVTWCDWDAAAGRLARGGVLPTVPPEWDLSKGSCADIHVSEDGRFVYASNRGHDSLAMFAVNAESGALSFLGTVETEQTPRSFCLLPGGGYVVAAGEGNGRLRVFKRDAVSGLLEVVGSYECGAGPAWVTALRRSGGAR
jgi:6-phosphogluconolactonase